MFHSLPPPPPVPTWVPTNTLSNPSCRKVINPPVQPVTPQCPLRLPLLIRMLNPTAVPVVRNKPHTSMLYITMVEARLSRSLLLVLALQNSLRNTPVDPKSDPLLNRPPVVLATLTLLTGDHDPVPPPVNLKPDSSDQPISCKTSLGGLVTQRVYLTMNSIPIFGASHCDFRGCIGPFSFLVFLPSTDTSI